MTASQKVLAIAFVMVVADVLTLIVVLALKQFGKL